MHEEGRSQHGRAALFACLGIVNADGGGWLTWLRDPEHRRVGERVVPGRAARTQRHRGAPGHQAPVPDERVPQEAPQAGPEPAARAATVEAGRPLAVPARTRGPAVTLLRGPGKASSALLAGLVLPVLPTTEHAGLPVRRRAVVRREIRLDVTGPHGAVMTPARLRVHQAQAPLGPVARLLAGRVPVSSATPPRHPMVRTSAIAGVPPPTGPARPLEPRRAVSSATRTGRHPGVSSVAAPGLLLMTSVTAPGPLPTATPVAVRGRHGGTVTGERRRLLTVAAPVMRLGRRGVTGLVARLGPPRADRAGPRRGTVRVTEMVGVSGGCPVVMTDVTTGPPRRATATAGPAARTGRQRATGPAGRTVLVPASAAAGHGPRTVTGIAEIPIAVAKGPVPAPATAADLALKARGQQQPQAHQTAHPVLSQTARPVLRLTVRLAVSPTGPLMAPQTGPLMAPQTVRPGSAGRMARLRDRPTVREARRAMAAATAPRGRIADAGMTGRRSASARDDPRPARTTGTVLEVRLRRTSRVRPVRRFPIRSAPTSSSRRHGTS
jgi:hypothetical protein